ncbi:MAG: hypothetical protein JRG92_00250 [Deltaproteobacteria bacterium]|jgi:hypothetical protein|nr:hypothetical protein [Deltaproteobacteria bacterium]MBW2382023.1 hypothetical protein [Deltaproteobacteria bacterium]MBW2695798.1 hypothetical protein [Deltaproteobacteria bacterium]
MRLDASILAPLRSGWLTLVIGFGLAAGAATAAASPGTGSAIPGPPIRATAAEAAKPGSAQPGAFCPTGFCRPAQASPFASAAGFGLCAAFAGLAARRRSPLAD